MASLKKRGKTYYVQHYVGGKKVVKSLQTRSLQVAKELLRKFESAQARGQGDLLPTRTPLNDAVERFVAHARAHKADKQAQNEILRLRMVFGDLPALGDTRRSLTTRRRGRRPRSRSPHGGSVPPIRIAYLEQLTPAAVSEFLAEGVRIRGWSAKTANSYRQLLIRLCNWAMEEGGCNLPGDRNPARRVRRYREKTGEIRFLTLRQIDEQLSALDHDRQLQTLVAVYIYAGLRRGEALWLRTEDIDLDAGTHGLIRIRPKTVGGETWGSKTGIARAVPISSDLRNYLDRYTPPPSDHDWLFPSPDGTRWDPDNFSHRALLPAQNAAGLPWTCLDFRHTFGSQLAQKGETLYKISKLMGNSPEICRKHYAALMAEDLTESVEFPKPKQDPAPDPPPADSLETPAPPAFKLHLPEAPTVSPARRTGA